MFNDPKKLEFLNHTIHPEIAKYLKIIEKDISPEIDILAVEGAVLIESGNYKNFDEVWVTKLDKKIAFTRIKERNPELQEQQILKRLNA